jgi:hypothetical protein
MRFIREINEEIQILQEEKDGKKHYYIEGVFLQACVKNRNKRFYPESVMESAVNKYVTEKISKGSAYGELSHPNGPNINMERVSHIIKSLKKEGTNFIGKAVLIDEGYGKIARSLVDYGARLGVSSRGLGTLKERDGIMEVQSDFFLATAADIVADPSAPEAYVQSVMEDAEWIYTSGQWFPRFVEEQKVEINKAAASVDKTVLEEQAIKSFHKFLSRL